MSSDDNEKVLMTVVIMRWNFLSSFVISPISRDLFVGFIHFHSLSIKLNIIICTYFLLYCYGDLLVFSIHFYVSFIYNFHFQFAR